MDESLNKNHDLKIKNFKSKYIRLLKTNFKFIKLGIKFIIFLVILAFSTKVALSQDFNIIQNYSLSFFLYNYFCNFDSLFNKLKMDLKEDSFEYKLNFYYSIYFVSKSTQAFLSLYSKNLINDVSFNDNSILTDKSLSLMINQAWVKIIIESGWSIAFGRKLVDWSECHFFVNPSDMINNQKYFGEDEDISGKDLIEILGFIDLFDHAFDISLVILFYNSSEKIEDIPLFFSLGTILYPFELKFKAMVQNKEKPEFANTSSIILGDFQIFFDILYYQESDIKFLDKPNENYFKYVIGVTYSSTFKQSNLIDGISFCMEYFHRDDGMTKEEADTFYSNLLNLYDSNQLETFTNLISQLKFFQYYKNYLFCNISLYEIFNNHINLDFSIYYNIEDSGFLYIICLSLSPKNLFQVIITYMGSYGKQNTEVMQIPYKSYILITFSKSI